MVRKNLIGFKTLRKYIKQEVSNAHVSKDGIIYLQMEIENKLREVCQKAKQEHERLNQRYKELGLPQRKRIGIMEYKRASGEVFNQSPDVKLGVGRQHDSEIPISRSDKMKETTKQKAVERVEVQ